VAVFGHAEMVGEWDCGRVQQDDSGLLIRIAPDTGVNEVFVVRRSRGINGPRREVIYRKRPVAIGIPQLPL